MPNKKLFTAPSVEGVRLRRSFQDCSYQKLTTMDFGKLYVSICDEVLPGDIVRAAQRVNVKFQPLITPTFGRFYLKTHLFFVPNRLVWNQWEDFITSGKDGLFPDVLPTVKDDTDVSAMVGINTLWDSFGLPIPSATNPSEYNFRVSSLINDMDSKDLLPLAFPFRAYNLIWNEYYRDEDLQDELPITDYGDLLPVSWMKDYYTSARPWQQKGVAPRIPAITSGLAPVTYMKIPYESGADTQIAAVVNASNGISLSTPNPSSSGRLAIDPTQQVGSSPRLSITLSPADIRFGMQIQRFLELNARAGNRYIEFLNAQYGVAPSSAVLQRPDYIGGLKQDIIVSEVLQTSSTDATSPQANRAATANIIGANKLGSYRVKEHGWIIGLSFVVAVPEYQNNLNRQWVRRSRYDYYFRLFNDLSEQPIKQHEVFYPSPAAAADPHKNIDADIVFGFTGRWNEYRTKDNIVTGQMRSPYAAGESLFKPHPGSNDSLASLDYWHVARRFNVNSQPRLNSEFIRCNPTKDFLAVQNEPPMLVCFNNYLEMFRPMSAFSNPGRVDHMG